MDENLKKMLSYLRLQGITQHWRQYLEMAEKEQYSYTNFFSYIIEQEYKRKKENARKMRLARAKIPRKLLIETFPFDRQPNLNRKKIVELYDSFDYVKLKRNIIWIGNTGVGKTGLATAFLIQAINKGYTGFFILFPELLELLYKSVADHSEAKLIKTLAAYDCLLIDEFGYVEVEPIQVGLFFTLMNKRYKNKTTFLTSNLGFKKWTSFLNNDQLTAALIDRLTETSYVFNMKKCKTLRKKLENNSDEGE